MDDFNLLVKPPLSPDGKVFPIVWTLLYMLMGIALYLILGKRAEMDIRVAVMAFIFNLILNFGWSIVFFREGAYLTAFLWIILYLLSTLWVITEFKKIVPVAGMLYIPLLIWVCFATYLNLAIVVLNGCVRIK